MDPSSYLENDETYTCITDRYTNLPEIIKNAYENGKMSSMLEKLNEIIEFSQKEIDSVCRNDSLNILDCLNGLDRLKSFYETVKKSYLSLNFKVDEVFSEYDKSIGELQKYQTIERNISMTVQFLVKCLPALTIDKIFDQSIDPSNYIDLIDSCCKLEKMHDPIVSQIPIIKRIYDSIPRIRNNIKADAIENLKTFLNKTMENFSLVGFRYWSKAIKSFYPKIPDLELSRLNSADPLFLNIDFKPVYWYSYILQTLPHSDNDLKFYTNQRKEQLLLIYNYDQKSDPDKKIDIHLESMLYSIVGYMAVEHFILHSVKNFITQDYILEAYASLCNFILLHLANSIRNHEQFSKIRDIKIVLSRFDRIMQSFSVESNILSRSVNVFSSIFFKVMGNEIQDIEISLDVGNHFIKHHFSSAEEQFSTLSFFSVPHSDAQYPITLEIPKFLNDLIFKYMKVCGIEKERSGDLQIGAETGNQNIFETLIGFSDIAIRRINLFFDQNKTLDGSIIAYYNATFLKQFFSTLTQDYNHSKECQVELENFRIACSEMIAKVDDSLTDFAKEKIFDTFNHFSPDFNPINENADISPVMVNMMDYICDIFEKLAEHPSQIFDNFVSMCSSKISDIFVSFVSLNNFNSCNKHFISSMMNHMNYVKLRLMENSEKQIHSKIENDFNEFKMTLNLILIDDWPNYFDNYGLSFSPYFRVNPDILLKVTKKLLASENASIKQTFSKFFTKEKKEKTNLNEIIASLQKLIYKNH